MGFYLLRNEVTSESGICTQKIISNISKTIYIKSSDNLSQGSPFNLDEHDDLFDGLAVALNSAA